MSLKLKKFLVSSKLNDKSHKGATSLGLAKFTFYMHQFCGISFFVTFNITLSFTDVTTFHVIICTIKNRIIG